MSPEGDTDPWVVNMSDMIFEQTIFTLDAAGNTTLASFFQRNNGDSSTGPLDLDERAGEFYRLLAGRRRPADRRGQLWNQRSGHPSLNAAAIHAHPAGGPDGL